MVSSWSLRTLTHVTANVGPASINGQPQRGDVMETILISNRISGRAWTPEQLHALAEADRKAQRHVEHMAARVALANHSHLVDVRKLGTLVADCLGTSAGTYWMAAALHLAQLAIAFPQLLTDVQRALLLAPLEAAERLAPAAVMPAAA